MKKILCLVYLAVLATVNTNVFADSTATYTGSASNKVRVTDTDSYSTVLITKVSDNADQSDPLSSSSIAYVNQAASLFDAQMQFIIKSNPSYGKYKVVLGSESGDAESTYFYIGIDAIGDDLAMTRLGEKQVDDLWRVGYVITVTPEVYNESESIKVAFDSNSVSNVISVPSTVTFGGYNLKEGGYPTGTVASGSGDIKLAFQINDVPGEYKDSITVFLSENELSDDFLLDQQGGNSE